MQRLPKVEQCPTPYQFYTTSPNINIYLRIVLRQKMENSAQAFSAVQPLG